MQNKRIAVLLAALILALGCAEKKEKPKTAVPTLREKIGQLVMVGFRGTTVGPNDPIYHMIKEQHIGGVVLYNRDLPSKDSLERNISSPEQLRKLNHDLQQLDSVPLFIGIDEEGGFVTRLNPENGFQYHRSHQAIGAIDVPDTTRAWAKGMAAELANLGINMDFAPDVDININPNNPVIGARERSFSSDVDAVVRNAKIFMEEHEKLGILCVPKHFPGHGSSDKDSHKGLTDVTETWSEKELIPFRTLVNDGLSKVIMTSHVYNAQLDTLPATLSPKIIHNLLRKDFGFKGIIMSDDMQMRAISNFYDFGTSIEKAIDAGVDMLLFSENAAPCPEGDTACNEIPFEPDMAKKVVDYIEKLVQDGKIAPERIDESYQRIMKVKASL